MVKVGIIGYSGRLGKPLVEILNKHPHAEIVYTKSKTEGGSGNLSDPELFFLSLPRGESEKYLPTIAGKKVIDLSIDNRLNDKWIYGLPELNKDKIKGSQKIANPGCYATSIILGLAPLKGKVCDIRISSTSGMSGGGFEVQEQDNFLIYKEGRAHEQIREIEKMLGLEEILFVPQRIDTADKGIVSTIFGNYAGSEYTGSEDLIELYREFYKSMPFVRITNYIETKNVNGTNFCDIKVSKFKDKIIIITTLDNLIKGGSGQAVQNFNLMYGFNETTGLSKV